MKKPTLILLLLLGSLSTQAQELPAAAAIKCVSLTNAAPLVLVDSMQTTMDALIVAPGQIASIKVFKEQEALKKHGAKARYGVIEVTLNENLSLVRLPDVYDHFLVPQAQRQLPLAIDDKPVTHKELLLADIRLIQAVERKTQNITAVQRISFDEDAPYLNIVTLKH